MTDHPHYKTGRRPPKNAPALMLADILTGVAPTHPVTADHIRGVTFDIYGNDTYGDCGPTDVGNSVRAVSYALTGEQVSPSLGDVLDLYRRSGNPAFDPNDPEGPGDGGVDMQTMYEALLAGGIGDGKGGVLKPVAFAKVNVGSDTELDAALSIFGVTSWGVNLENDQQAQTDAGRWDYSPSPDWGGHAIPALAYDEGLGTQDVITWALRVATTAAFRRHQLEEAWVVVWPWHIDHPAFQEGIDLVALASAYKALTGKTLPVPTPAPTPAPPTPAPTPEPTPTPVPGGGANTGPFQVGPVSARVAHHLADRAAQRHMTVEEYLTWHIEHGSAHWRD